MSYPNFRVFLYQPLIPQNTGNIGRLCVGFNAQLIILGEPAFSLSDKNLRRAGLDYWPHLNWHHEKEIENWEPPKRCFAVSKFSEEIYYDEEYLPGDSFIFGNETKGLPVDLRSGIKSVRIPMNTNIRSYNLANSVAIVLSEAVRQVSIKRTGG